MIDPTGIRARFTLLLPHLDERRRRLFAATEARTAGYGGIAAVSRATGIAVSTIGRGLKELATAAQLDADRVRRPGGGRKPLVATDAALLDDLLALVAPSERGDPMSPLRWTCKSLRRLARELAARGHRISHTVVGELLKQQKFSLQANCKTREGGSHPDREAQFAYISQSVSAALAEQQPVISVDTKKKELVGHFRNGGREWHPRGAPEDVRVHDFLIKELGRAVPYGIYDLAANAGWVSVGMDHDTAAFAVQTIRRWWREIGYRLCPISRCQAAGDHRRWRRQQRLARAAVEARVARPRDRTRPRHHGSPPAAWHEQVEQDRAPPVLVHQHELAGQAAGQLPCHH